MKNLLTLLIFSLITMGSAFGQTSPSFPSLPVETEQDEIFKVVDEMPRFPGCEDIIDMNQRKQCSMGKMLSFISNYIEYPEEAIKNGVEGTTVIRFFIDRDGSIGDPRIVKEIGAGCGEESLRIVKLMNDMPQKWTPGIQKGKTVRVYFNLPIKFGIPKDEVIEN